MNNPIPKELATIIEELSHILQWYHEKNSQNFMIEKNRIWRSKLLLEKYFSGVEIPTISDIYPEDNTFVCVKCQSGHLPPECSYNSYPK